MAKKLANPLDEFGLPMFKEPVLLDVPDSDIGEVGEVVNTANSKRKVRSDKGKRRKQYVMKFRTAKKEINNDNGMLEDVAKKEREFEKQKSIDYQRGGKTRNERYQEARLKLLPNPRICPLCRKIKPLSKQWCIKNNSKPICKSCHWHLNILKKPINNVVNND